MLIVWLQKNWLSIAFLERVRADFMKTYGNGKADTAVAASLNSEFGYLYTNKLFLIIKKKICIKLIPTQFEHATLK